jgi:hypothetical protein
MVENRNTDEKFNNIIDSLDSTILSSSASPKPNTADLSSVSAARSPFQQVYSKLSDSFKYFVDNAASVKEEFSKLSKEEREKFASLSDEQREQLVLSKLSSTQGGATYLNDIPSRPAPTSNASKRLTVSEFNEMIGNQSPLSNKKPPLKEEPLESPSNVTHNQGYETESEFIRNLQPKSPGKK